MHLHWGWAVFGALALGAALAWWMSRNEQGEPSREDPHRTASVQVRTHVRGGEPASGDRTVFYRWVDAHGGVNVSNTRPAAGTRYTIVRIDPNQNVVPMAAPGDPSTTTAGAH